MTSEVTSKLIDRVFEIRKSKLILIIIFILGFSLRFIAATNLTVSADDMHHVTHAVNFFSAGRLITYDQSSGLWHAFTSIIYKFFGMTQLTSRFASLIFGSFSILVIYLLSKEFFNERTSILSAFLLALSPFHILNTVAEMDVMAIFFVLTGMLLFIKAFKANNYLSYILSGVFFGLAVYTKVYPILFVPSVLLFFIYFKKKENNKVISKRNIKGIFLFLVFIFVFTMPVLTHNYLLYKDKGFTDLQFTRVFGLGKNISSQYYEWDHQFSAKNDWKGLILGNSDNSSITKPTLLSAIDFIRLGDPINFYFGLLGIIIIIFSRKEYYKYIIFFLLSIIFALPFLASIILLPKHFLFVGILITPMAALAVAGLTNRLSSLLKKDAIKIIAAVILIFSLIVIGLPSTPGFFFPVNYHFYGKSNVAQIIEFKEDNIPKNALIVGDSRIYRGIINWAFQGRPYLEGVDFVSLINNQDNIQGNTVLVDIYYLECIKDDCGWGTVKDQPDFNASMESLTDFFKKNGKLVKTISEPYEKKSYFPLSSSEKKEDIINVYSAQIKTKDSLLLIASQPKKWFLYDIGYLPKEKQFDYYKTHSFFDALINKIAHWIVLIALIFALLSPLYVIYLTRRK